MLNKYIVSTLISSISALSYFPSVHANDYSAYPSHQSINRQAWFAFKNEKKRKYQMEHTLDRAPFPNKISSGNVIKVNLGKLAWAAYDDQGNIVKWGSTSGGKSFCSDINQSCKTVVGSYTFYKKQGANCKSNLYPVGRGGAPMPYCMHFSGGFALHGSEAVPNFNASHGCVRVPVNEAQWLNQHFVKIGTTRIDITY